MTTGECLKNKWFYMKYIGKYLSLGIFLTYECTIRITNATIQSLGKKMGYHWNFVLYEVQKCTLYN